MIEELPSQKICKDCGKPSYSFRIGWIDNEGIKHWHSPKTYNQCKECRKEMYKKIEEKKKEARHSSQA